MPPTGRSPAKGLFDALTAVAVAPRTLTFAVRCRLLGRERAYLELSERAARWPGVRGERMRVALHRRIGTQIGEHAVLRFGCVLERPPLSIGRMTMLGHYAHVQHRAVGGSAGPRARAPARRRRHRGRRRASRAT